MGIIDQSMLWRQFDLAITNLEHAIRACPEHLWESQLWQDEPDQWVAAGFSNFWYLTYHTLFWIDLYLTGTEEGFMPPAPFALVEMRDNETLPRTYTPSELLGYLEHCRQATQSTIMQLSTEQAELRCSFSWGEVPFGELMIYTLRHVQEHGAHLHMFLSQQARGKA